MSSTSIFAQYFWSSFSFFKRWYKKKRESFILINVFTLFLQDVQQLLLIIYLSRSITFALLLLTCKSSGCTTI